MDGKMNPDPIVRVQLGTEVDRSWQGEPGFDSSHLTLTHLSSIVKQGWQVFFILGAGHKQ